MNLNKFALEGPNQMYHHCSFRGPKVWRVARANCREDGQTHPPHERDRERDEGDQDVLLGTVFHTDGPGG